ncbi:MAG: NTP transferase domain-containing protein [Oscillospiraceae bacterium]|nr:NTP transferase domain-containing protein [Oscillospiraceae bacterium]
MSHSTLEIDNAVILAAGFASRFAPLSRTTPKALLNVRGEILIERQIRQLREAGIHDIYVVTGYLGEQFSYLTDRWGVTLIENREYQTRNNHSSVWAARGVLANTYICSSDNYFPENVFSASSPSPYYSALYAHGPTEEYCLATDESGRITDVRIGGADSWYMLGHVLFDTNFSSRFLKVLEAEYDLPETQNLMWEDIYRKHLEELTLYIKKYSAGSILEFDTLDELCRFDSSYCAYRDSLSK